MLINRLKIFLLLLVLLFLSVLFWQNQELLSLKLLCPDVNQSCLYQTPPLPLAIWMLIFTLAGVVTSLIWQLLNYLSAKGARKPKSSGSTPSVAKRDTLPKGSPAKTKTQPSNQSRSYREKTSVETKTQVNPRPNDNSTKRSDWEEDRRNDDWYTEEPTPAKTKPNYKTPEDSRKKQNSETSYRYKPRSDNDSKEPKVDRVYDANYRVINQSLRKNNDQTRQDEDDEWI